MESSKPIAAPLRRLLEDVVDSFEKLEVVRRLWRNRDVAWSIDRLTEEIRVPRDRLGFVMAELAGHGLVVAGPSSGEYRASSDSTVAGLVEALVTLFERDPLAVLPIINEQAMERIRGMAARTFADAFIVRRAKKRKEPGDG